MGLLNGVLQVVEAVAGKRFRQWGGISIKKIKKIKKIIYENKTVFKNNNGNIFI